MAGAKQALPQNQLLPRTGRVTPKSSEGRTDVLRVIAMPAFSGADLKVCLGSPRVALLPSKCTHLTREWGAENDWSLQLPKVEHYLWGGV